MCGVCVALTLPEDMRSSSSAGKPRFSLPSADMGESGMVPSGTTVAREFTESPDCPLDRLSGATMASRGGWLG
jgi:hypothetical protein